MSQAFGQKRLKGITPVISIIIILLISTALAGAAWTYINMYFSSLTAAGIEVVDSFYTNSGRGVVLIENKGVNAIDVDSISIVDTQTGDDISGIIDWSGVQGTKLYPGDKVTISIVCSGSCEYKLFAGHGFVATTPIFCGSRGACVTTPVVPTCDDGYMNGDEEGVDCGGSCPDTCPEPPTEPDPPPAIPPPPSI